MADNLNPPAGAVPPPAAGSKVQPKKETVRISLPPKPAAKETVRLELPPRAPAAAAPAAPKLAAPVAPKPAAPAAPAAGAAPVAAKQTVRLSLPPKPSAAKETVRLELPPKPAAGGVPGAAKPAGGNEVKLLVPQVNEAASSAAIPESTEDMPTMAASPAQPAAVPVKPAGLRGGPPGSKPAAASAGPAPDKAAAPASAQPDSTSSAMALPAKKALPKPADMVMAPVATGGVVVRKAGWPDYLLASLALLTGLAALGRLFMLIGGK